MREHFSRLTCRHHEPTFPFQRERSVRRGAPITCHYFEVKSKIRATIQTKRISVLCLKTKSVLFYERRNKRVKARFTSIRFD